MSFARKVDRASKHPIGLDRFRTLAPDPFAGHAKRGERRAMAKAQGIYWRDVETKDVPEVTP